MQGRRLPAVPRAGAHDALDAPSDLDELAHRGGQRGERTGHARTTATGARTPGGGGRCLRGFAGSAATGTSTVGNGELSSALRSMSLNSAAATSCTFGPWRTMRRWFQGTRRRGAVDRVELLACEHRHRQFVLRLLRCERVRRERGGSVGGQRRGRGRVALSAAVRCVACLGFTGVAFAVWWRRSPARVLAACSRMNCMISSGLSELRRAPRSRGRSQARPAAGHAASAQRQQFAHILADHRDSPPPRQNGTGRIPPRRRDRSLTQMRNYWRNSVISEPSESSTHAAPRGFASGDFSRAT